MDKDVQSCCQQQAFRVFQVYRFADDPGRPPASPINPENNAEALFIMDIVDTAGYRLDAPSEWPPGRRAP